MESYSQISAIAQNECTVLFSYQCAALLGTIDKASQLGSKKKFKHVEEILMGES